MWIVYRHRIITKNVKTWHLENWENGSLTVFITDFVSNSLHSCSKSTTPKQILGVPLSQLLRQWRSWRTGSAAYALSQPEAMIVASHNMKKTNAVTKYNR